MNDFRQASIDFLNGKLVNMGSFQYDDHLGMRNGVSTSGYKQWSEADQKRAAPSQTGEQNMASVERESAKKVAADIKRRKLLPEGLPTVELGPGTLGAFVDQTLPIIQAFRGVACTIVDKARRFLEKICDEENSLGLRITPIESDFFESNDRYYNEDNEALLVMFGTISNINASISDELPKVELVEGLKRIANRINKGWLLLSFDSDQDGEKIKSYYQEHELFQLNIFDRMAIEGLEEGWLDNRFDPTAFNYIAEWHPTSGQLAHTAVVNRDMTFSLNGKEVTFETGKKLHIKNSYKHTPEFFEECCKPAGLEVVEAWLDSSVKFYLLKKLMSDEVPQFNQRSDRRLVDLRA